MKGAQLTAHDGKSSVVAEVWRDVVPLSLSRSRLGCQASVDDELKPAWGDLLRSTSAQELLRVLYAR